MILDDIRARIEDGIDRGFPLTGAVPQTGIGALIDYVGSLDATERAEFISALALHPAVN